MSRDLWQFLDRSAFVCAASMVSTALREGSVLAVAIAVVLSLPFYVAGEYCSRRRDALIRKEAA